MANKVEAQAGGRSQEELLTLNETIEYLGISKQTLYRMMERGELKGLKVGRQWRFRRADLAAFLRRGPEAAALIAAPADVLEGEIAFFAGELRRRGDTSPLADANGWDAAESAVDLAARKVEKLAHQLIKLAIYANASDIHLEPARQSLTLRYRIDGVLTMVRELPREVHAALLRQLMTQAGMNCEDSRMPQDGRIHLHDADSDRHYDLRVNVLPTIYGENAVLRVLSETAVQLNLPMLDLPDDTLARLRRLCHLSHGMVLVTGPTGSGKTTTLYACLNDINRPEVKILTVEDPVEYALPGMTQVAVNRKAGLTFAVATRAFLRQDPDIIMAGEIRDLETLQVLIQAALTGHLVFSTMHTANAVDALTRLVEIGVEPFMITAAVQGIVAQRLARKLCPHCRTLEMPTTAMRAHLAQLARDGGYDLPEDTVFHQAVGCEQCAGRGYRGRMALQEILECTPALREALLSRATPAELTAIAVQDGMRTLLADGLRKAAAGQTTVEEVMRVTAG